MKLEDASEKASVVCTTNTSIRYSIFLRGQIAVGTSFVQEKMREAEDDMETQEEEVKTLNASIKSAQLWDITGASLQNCSGEF